MVAEESEVDESQVESLQRLGLTEYESRIYLTILKYGPIKASEVSFHAHVPRTKTYGAIRQLQDKGLISIPPGKPEIYRIDKAPDEVLSPMVNDLESELKKSRNLIQTLALAFKTKMIVREPIRKGLTGRGRPVSYKNFSDRTNRDIAIAASVRLAARHGLPFHVRKDDLRTKIREGRIKASLILVLDSSESMIDSLNKVRDAIRAVKRGATRMRDRVGLIVFKGEEAHVLQHPTTNFNLIMQKLTNVGLSDFTPLAAGIMRAVRLARTEEARGYAPIVVMATDGVANVSIPRWSSRIYEIPDPATDALVMARAIAVNKWKTVVANMAHVREDGPADMVMGTHLMMNIAFVTKGVYVGFSRKKDEATVLNMSQTSFAELDDLSQLRGR